VLLAIVDVRGSDAAQMALVILKTLDIPAVSESSVATLSPSLVGRCDQFFDCSPIEAVAAADPLSWDLTLAN
jgi:hypothetical protein